MMKDLREVHDQLLDILIEFDRICRKHGILYSLAWGTMLGAVRHGGFIPWDCDIDVIMMRDEYDHFCSVCEQELKEEYFFQTKYSDPPYRYNVARLRKNNTAMIFRTWKNSGFHQGIYIDIQPLDYLADGKLERFIQKFFIIVNTPIRMSMNKTLYLENGNQYGKLIKTSLLLFSSVMPKKLCDRIEHYFITKYNRKKTEYVGVICEGGVLVHTTRDMLPFSARYMEKLKEINFEGHSFLCAEDTDSLLKLWYGNYMELPPVEKRVVDHDPLVFDANNSYEMYI